MSNINNFNNFEITKFLFTSFFNVYLMACISAKQNIFKDNGNLKSN